MVDLPAPESPVNQRQTGCCSFCRERIALSMFTAYRRFSDAWPMLNGVDLKKKPSSRCREEGEGGSSIFMLFALSSCVAVASAINMP